MPIKQQLYGQTENGSEVSLFTLSNKNGLKAEITNYGGILVSLWVPDRAGQLDDIVLGKPDLGGYLDGHPYFGALTGRVAGRIIGAAFTCGGQKHKLDANNGAHCLHGGLDAWDKQIWSARIIEEEGIEKLQLKYRDPHGKNHFPGNLDLTVTYALCEDNALEICYRARCDQDTPFNPTNHSYFNLSGDRGGTVLDHQIQISADRVAEALPDMTLTGNTLQLTPQLNDLRAPIRIGDLSELSHRNVDTHYFFPDGRTDVPRPVACVYDPKSGRTLELQTTEPGVQFYAAINLSLEAPETGKDGKPYPLYGAFCLETQDYPNSINHPQVGSAFLKADQPFYSCTRFCFK